MPEYIERERIIKDLQNTAEYRRECGCTDDIDIESVINYVKKMPPAAYVVKVVLCGNCKHWEKNPNNLYGGQCRFSECASIDHYCSRGERKEQNKCQTLV